MELYTSLHKRSKSDCTNINEEGKFSNILKSSDHPQLDMGQLKNCLQLKKRHLTNAMVRNSLKQEILELQKQLQNQFAMRGALERAIRNHKPDLHDSTFEYTISKPTKDLIKDVAILELEVLYLEKYLLSMYRKTFSERLTSSFVTNEHPKSSSATDKQLPSELAEVDTMGKSVINGSRSMPSGDSLESSLSECRDILGAEVLADSSVQRSHSSLSQCSAIAFKNSPSLGTLAEAVDSYHSLPLSMLERAKGSASASLGTSFQEHIWETPNTISEEMVKSISTIYCQLADPPLLNPGFPSSPVSFTSSLSSPREQQDTWSQQFKEKTWLDNSFHIESFEEFTPPFPTTAEVHGIRRDAESLRKIEFMLKKFRCLVSALGAVDPQKMKREEKLAFWINVHNALVMHAFLVYGIRRSNLKRMSLLIKAAYNVGGHNVSVDMIQSSILACRLPRPGQWLQSLFFPRAKSKARDSWKAYAVVRPEPRLHFALCSGSHSDPVLRLYTPKRVYQELEVAKEEYIQANMRVEKDLKLMLPKKVDSFVKESSLSPSGLVELIDYSLPHYLRKFQQPQETKFWKKIVWVPHNFSFRYLIADELIK